MMKTLIKLNLLFYSLPFVFLSCTNSVNYKMEGARGSSESITESIKRGTFVESYCIEHNTLSSISIEDAFIEKGFGYGKTINETKPDFYGIKMGAFQFIIVFKRNENDSIDEIYRFVVANTNKSSSCQKSKLSCPIDSSDINDTIRFYIQNKYSAKDTLGSLIFIQCKK